MKRRRVRRFRILAVLFLFLVGLLFLLVLFSPEAKKGYQGMRGAQEARPSTFSLFEPGSWSTPFGAPRDWFPMAKDALDYGGFTPWSKPRHLTFGQRHRDLYLSKDPADKALLNEEKERSKEWRDRLLARYPDLVVKYRPVPDEKNGLLNLRQLAARLGDGQFRMADKLKDPYHFTAQGLDLDEARAWLYNNRELLEEFRLIGSMQERSSMDIDRLHFAGDLAREAAIALMVNARVAMEGGNTAAALVDVRAARGLAAHLMEADVMSDVFASNGTAIMRMLNNYSLRELMPRVPDGQLDPQAWESALNLRLEQPSTFANRIRAEWHRASAYHLPALALDTNPPHDTDLMIENYTSQMAAIARANDSIGYADLSSTVLVMDESGLSWRAKQVSREINMTWEPGPNGELWDRRMDWLRDQQRTAFYQAAFAIMNGRPVPVDPVLAAPYKWNPATRELSMPNGGNSAYLPATIKLPKVR